MTTVTLPTTARLGDTITIKSSDAEVKSPKECWVMVADKVVLAEWNLISEDKGESTYIFKKVAASNPCDHESDGWIYPHDEIPFFPPHQKCIKCGEFYK